MKMLVLTREQEEDEDHHDRVAKEEECRGCTADGHLRYEEVDAVNKQIDGREACSHE